MRQTLARAMAIPIAALGIAQAPATLPIASVSIHVDAARSLGPVTSFWSFFGYDEPHGVSLVALT